MCKDIWNNETRENTYPHLFSFARCQYITIDKAMTTVDDNIYNMFTLPLSAKAHDELIDLQEEIHDITPNDNHDRWKLPWGKYLSTKKAYRALIGEHATHQTIKGTWKTCSILRQKFFAWLMLQERLNSKDIIRNKNFYVEFMHCILCDTCPEKNILHMFFECSFSRMEH
jgi:hypothetical protein